MATRDARKDLTITRIFDAKRELVWKAWTDSATMARWWGPRGVTNPICRLNARSGGGIYIVMLAGKELDTFAGQKWPMRGRFNELKPPEMLAYISEALDDKKGVRIASTVTLKLDDLGAKTRMTLHIVVTELAPGQEFALAGMETGWNQSLDKLAGYIKGIE